MKPATPLEQEDNSAEIATLIETLSQTEKRLEQLTGGEVDSVAGRDGQTFLLRRAQDQLRLNESARQAAILNALPTSVALLDSQGKILTVNEAWQQFGRVNGAHNPEPAISDNYLGVCDKARGKDSAEASAVATGIRAVLAGKVSTYTLEYPCHSPTEQRWFLMTISPLSHDALQGAVVMHIDISQRKQNEETLQQQKTELQVLFDLIPAMLWFKDAENRILRANIKVAQAVGMSTEEMAGRPTAEIYPDEAAKYHEDDLEVIRTGVPKLGIVEMVRGSDGKELWVQTDKVPVFDKDGDAVGIFVMALDITAHKLAEDSLRQAKDFLQLIVEHVPGRIFWKDLDYRFLGCNTRLAEDAGLSRPDELIGKTDFDMVWKDQAELYRTDDQAVLESGSPRLNIEEPQTTPDGDTIWLRTSKVPLRDSDDQIIGILGIYQDITESKRVAQELRESERRFADLLRNVDLISVMRDRDGRITYCNEYLLHLTGWRNEEVIGKCWIELFAPPEIAEQKQKVFAELLLDKPAARHHESDILTRSGERRLIYWNNSVLRSGAGDVTGTASIGEDITDRKAAERKIAYLNRVYAMHSDISTLIVRASDRDELFREACRVAVDIGGFHMAMIGIVNRDGTKTIPVASKGKDETLLNGVEKLMSSDALESNTMVTRAIKENKAIISNDAQNDPHVLIGKQYAAAGINSIIILPLIVAEVAIGALALFAKESNFFHGKELKLLTELVGDISFALSYLKAQEALHSLNAELENKVIARTADLEQARNEADQANHAKSAFVATMSHEIRTPLNGVIGMVDVLRQSSLKGYQVEMVDLISESAFSLLGIIEDILDLSKIEAGKLEIEFEPMPVADVVEKACGLLDHLATRKGVELTLFIDPAIPKEVLGDALRLRQVLVNVVSNAIKFSSGQDRQGKVSLRALLAGHGPNQVMVTFEVTDNGIGMDEETQARLFTAFNQADATTTRRFGGTGLGLVISGHLVERMGGEIIVHSTLGKGATFTVSLPFTPLPAKPIDGDTPVDLAGLSCLVLGDRGVTNDLAVYLTYGGALVERAPDLAAAIELIGTVSPGLWLFIIDNWDGTPPLEELRAACKSRLDLDPRFVVVEYGHHQPGMEPHFVVSRLGQRLHGPIQSMDMVTLDGQVMHRRLFLQAVAMAAGRAQEDEEKATPTPDRVGAITPPSREQALRQGRLILVAEDNETNQKVILHQLGLLGYKAEVASDGRKALEYWESGDYALLLADLHMPEMDGYQLTTSIRAAEDGKRRIPIIALTANALKGEADHCRAVGMDDYLSKPARLADLKTMLNKWLPTADVTRSDSLFPQAMASPRADPVDVSVLEGLVGSDPAVIHEILQDFRVSAAKTAAELKAAFAAGQATAAGAAAHKLKSSARSIGAMALGDLCATIERIGKTGQADTMAEPLGRFEVELAAVDNYLGSL